LCEAKGQIGVIAFPRARAGIVWYGIMNVIKMASGTIAAGSVWREDQPVVAISACSCRFRHHFDLI
jgi:hypothetical protein